MIIFFGIIPLRKKGKPICDRIFLAVSSVFIAWIVVGLVWLFLLRQNHAPFYFISEKINRTSFFVLGVLTGCLTIAWLLWRWRAGWIKLAKARKLEDLKAMSPDDFELIISKLFEAHGQKVDLVGGNSDHGIDIIVINELGEKWVVQCKRYKGSVGEPTIRDLYGTMQHEGAVGAYLMTTGTFTKCAQAWVVDKPIMLYDGESLIHLIRKTHATL